MARVLGVVRLSVSHEQSTSVERQVEKIEGWAKVHDHDIAGWAIDDGVSAKISPWERPELGPWLVTPERYDIVASWKLDRLSRSMKDFANLCEWSEKHAKPLVCIDDNINLTSAHGRLIANILAAFAEFERLTIQHRVQQGFEKVFTSGRWRGGPWPYGYRPYKAEDGHLYLKPWTETAEGIEDAPASVVREAVEHVLSGNSVTSFVRTLNERGVPLPSDAQKIATGKTPGEGKWSGVNLLRILRSKRLLGYMVQRSEVKAADSPTGKRETTEHLVYKDGKPVRRAKSLLHDEPQEAEAIFKRLQTALDSNRNGQAGNRYGGSPMLRVLFCGCGEPMYVQRGGHKSPTRYRCGSLVNTAQRCKYATVQQTLIHEIINDSFLWHASGIEVTEKVFIPGEDHTAELGQVEESITYHMNNLKPGGKFYALALRKSAEDSLASLSKEFERLSALPQRADRWEHVPTGKTYGEVWPDMDWQERGKLLRHLGVRVEWSSKSPTSPVMDLILPEDMKEKIRSYSLEQAA